MLNIISGNFQPKIRKIYIFSSGKKTAMPLFKKSVPLPQKWMNFSVTSFFCWLIGLGIIKRIRDVHKRLNSERELEIEHLCIFSTNFCIIRLSGKGWLFLPTNQSLVSISLMLLIYLISFFLCWIVSPNENMMNFAEGKKLPSTPFAFLPLFFLFESLWFKLMCWGDFVVIRGSDSQIKCLV